MNEAGNTAQKIGELDRYGWVARFVLKGEGSDDVERTESKGEATLQR